jgi:hypothetical protein
MQSLPNNISDKGCPLQEFDLQKRVYSFFLGQLPLAKGYTSMLEAVGDYTLIGCHE